MDSPVLIFNPPPHAVPDIIEDLSDPDLSMKDIAHEQQTTFAALVAWMARPDIRSQIRDFRSSSIERCKLIADNYLPIILKTCVRLINEYNDDESNRLYHPNNWNKPEQQRRNREAARKTLYLMLRLHALQLDEPVVHSDPSRKRTRYQPIEESRSREPESRAIELEPPRATTPPPWARAVPSADPVPSPCPPEIVPSPVAVTRQGDAPATQATQPDTTTANSTHATPPPSSAIGVPSADPVPLSSSPHTPTTPSEPSEPPSESSVDLPPSPPEGRTTVAGGRGGAAQQGEAERSQPPVTAQTSSSQSSDSRPSEGGPLDPTEPYSTDDLLTELTQDHPELAQAAQAVRGLLNNASTASTRNPSPEPRDPPPTRITNIVDHLLRTFSDDPDEAIERAKQRDHEPTKQELTNSS